MLDRYRIFTQPHHRRLMRMVATPHIDRIVDTLRSALGDREEAELWFRSTLRDLRESVLKEIKSQSDGDSYEREVMLSMIEIMLDEFNSKLIDECFEGFFNPHEKQSPASWPIPPEDTQ